MKKKIKIGILGISRSNVGSRTMARVITDQFLQKYTGSKTTVCFKIFLDGSCTNLPNQDFKNTDFDFWQEGKIEFLKDTISALFYFITKQDFFIQSRPNLIKIHECDFLIGAQGYLFYNHSSTRSITFSLSRILLSFFLGRNFYLFPQSFGPLNLRRHYFLYKFILPKAKKIYARGSQSKNRLSCFVEDNLAVCPDIAFLFDVPTEYRQKHCFQKEEATGFIGIIPNIKLKKKDKKYVEQLTKLTKTIIRNYKYKILLISYNTRRNKFDDLSVCKQIYSFLSKQEKEEAKVVDSKNYNLYDYKAIIGQLDFVIASRFHSAVAALSQSVPTITLAWSFKYKELLSWFDLEDYNIDFAHFSTKETVDLLSRAHKNKDEIRSLISKRLPVIREQVNNLFNRTYKENIYTHTTSPNKKWN